MEEKLRTLKLKKAMLWEQIQSLSTVSDSMFINFGKTEAEIMQLEKQIIQNTKNDLNED
jgi:hypothetical protein